MESSGEGREAERKNGVGGIHRDEDSDSGGGGGQAMWQQGPRLGW